MGDKKYTYDEADFVGLSNSPQQIDLSTLHQEVVNSTIVSQMFLGCEWHHDTDVRIWFTDDLSSPEETTLDNIVATHTGIVPIVTMDQTCQYTHPTDSYTSNETKSIILPMAMKDVIVHIVDPAVGVLLNPTLVSASGTGWDPGNISTNEANINNGNLADLCYNNSSSGNTSGKILGIDMGSDTIINGVKKYDYSGTYFDTEWEFIGSDDSDASSYDVIFSMTQTSAMNNPNPSYNTFADQEYRYFGWRCVSSNNVTYSIVTELELFSGTPATVEKELLLGTEFDYSIVSNTKIEVTNKGSARDFKVIVRGLPV